MNVDICLSLDLSTTSAQKHVRKWVSIQREKLAPLQIPTNNLKYTPTPTQHLNPIPAHPIHVAKIILYIEICGQKKSSMF